MRQATLHISYWIDHKNKAGVFGGVAETGGRTGVPIFGAINGCGGQLPQIEALNMLLKEVFHRSEITVFAEDDYLVHCLENIRKWEMSGWSYEGGIYPVAHNRQLRQTAWFLNNKHHIVVVPKPSPWCVQLREHIHCQAPSLVGALPVLPPRAPRRTRNKDRFNNPMFR